MVMVAMVLVMCWRWSLVMLLVCLHVDSLPVCTCRVRAGPKVVGGWPTPVLFKPISGDTSLPASAGLHTSTAAPIIPMRPTRSLIANALQVNYHVFFMLLYIQGD